MSNVIIIIISFTRHYTYYNQLMKIYLIVCVCVGGGGGVGGGEEDLRDLCFDAAKEH